MSNLKEFYKVDKLHAEIKDLKNKVKELESDNRLLNMKVHAGDYPCENTDKGKEVNLLDKWINR